MVTSIDEVGAARIVPMTASTKTLVRGMCSPRKLRICVVMIRMPTPAVYPTTTVCEMKLTRAPRRKTAKASSMIPVMAASVIANST